MVMTSGKKKSKVCPRIRNFNINDYLILLLVNGQILVFGYCFFFIEGHGMFCGFLQTHDTLQPTTGLKVWDTSPNIIYQQETLQLHFNSIVCTLPLPPLFCWGGGGQPPTKFSKRGGA